MKPAQVGDLVKFTDVHIQRLDVSARLFPRENSTIVKYRNDFFIHLGTNEGISNLLFPDGTTMKVDYTIVKVVQRKV